MKEQYKVSVIIPTYNAESVIGACLDSVLNQTEKGIEIICVDDGSTDGTLNIIDEYARNNNNIIVRRQNHCGAGIARNVGIEVAKGKYISFLDSDDIYFEKYALERMIKACITHHTKVCGSFLVNYIDGEYKDVDIFPNVKISNRGAMVLFEQFQNDFYYQCFIYDREIFKDNSIRFPSYLRYQDPPLFLKIMLTCKSFWVEPVRLYAYSFSNNEKKEHNNIKYILDGITDNITLAINNGYHDLYNRLIDRLDNYYYDLIMENVTIEILGKIFILSEVIKTSPWGEKCILIEHILKRIKDYKRKCDSNYLLEKINDMYCGNYKTRYIKELKEEEIVIYGVGYFGEKLIDCMEFVGVKIAYAIDVNKAGQKYKNISILDDVKAGEKKLIVVALIDGDEVINRFKGRKAILIGELLTRLTKH